MSHSVVKESPKPIDNTLILVRGQDGSLNIDHEVLLTILTASNENQQVSILHVTDEDDQSAELVLETFQMASNEDLAPRGNSKSLMDHDYTPYTSPSQFPHRLSQYSRIFENETTGDPKLDELMKTLASFEEEDEKQADDLRGFSETLQHTSHGFGDLTNTVTEIVTSSQTVPTQMTVGKSQDHLKNRKSEKGQKLKINNKQSDYGKNMLFSSPDILVKKSNVQNVNIKSQLETPIGGEEVQGSLTKHVSDVVVQDNTDFIEDLNSGKENVNENSSKNSFENGQLDISNLELDCNTEGLIPDDFINDVAKLVDDGNMEAVITDDFLKKIDKPNLMSEPDIVSANKPIESDVKLAKRTERVSSSTKFETEKKSSSFSKKSPKNVTNAPKRSPNNKNVKTSKNNDNDELDKASEDTDGDEEQDGDEDEDEDDDDIDNRSWNSEDDPDRLWCICQKPHNNRFMICCDRCEDWFHGKCVNVTQSMGKKWELVGKDWVCPKCIKKQHDNEDDNKSKPKSFCVECRAQTDNRAAYCSDKCMSAHIEGVEKFALMDKITTKCIGGAALPSILNLKNWLKDHPTYQVVKRPKSEAEVIQKNRQEKYRTKFIDISSLPEIKKPIISNSTTMSTSVSTTISHASNSTSSQTKNIILTSFNTLDKKPDIKSEKKIKERSEKRLQSLKSDHDKDVAIKLPQAKISPSDREKLVRERVRKVMEEHLTTRLSECSDVKIETDELIKLINEIELELYKTYGNTGQKYHTKYRSLLFNIKDAKNETLWRKICEKKIAPSRLVQLSSDELASQELSSWRERETKHQLEIIKRSEIEALNTKQSFFLKSHRGEELMEVVKPKSTVDSIEIDDGSIVAVDNVSRKNFKDPITSIINELGEKRKDKDQTSDERHSKKHKSSSKDRDKDKDKDKEKDKDRSKKDYDRKHDRSKDKNHKSSSSQKDKDKDNDKDKDRDRVKDKYRDNDKVREKHDDKSKEKYDDATKTTESENIKDFTLKFHSDELDEGSKALLKDIETLTQVDDSLLREFEKKKELEEQKKLEELKKLDEFQLQEELNKQEEERLTKQIEELEREVNERELKLNLENDLSVVSIGDPDDVPVEDAVIVPRRSSKKDKNKLQSYEPKSILKNTSDDSYVSKNVIFAPNSPSVDYSVSNAKWRGLVHNSDTLNFFINAVELSVYSTDFETDLSKFLQVKGRLDYSVGWKYIEKMKKSQIAILQLVPASYEDTVNYMEYFSYLHTRSRLGVVKCETEGIKDFYIYPLAENCQLPAILQNFVSKKIDDVHANILLAILVRSKKRSGQLNSSIEDPVIANVKKYPENVGNLVDPRMKKVTVPLPPIITPKKLMSTKLSSSILDDDDLDEPYSPTDDTGLDDDITDYHQTPSVIDIASSGSDSMAAKVATSGSSSKQNTLDVNEDDVADDNKKYNPPSILENFEPFSNTFNSIPGLDNNETSDEESGNNDKEIDYLGKINLPTNLQEILQNIKNINSSTTNQSTYGPPSSKRPKFG